MNSATQMDRFSPRGKQLVIQACPTTMASRRRRPPKVSFASPVRPRHDCTGQAHRLLEASIPQLLHEDSTKKVIIFKRADLIFVFNFHPYQSFTDYRFEAPPGKYRMILDCDAPEYGGRGLLQPKQTHFTIVSGSKARSQHMLSLYLPTRSAFVLCPATEDPQP